MPVAVLLIVLIVLFVGLLFVLVVLFFPRGLLGFIGIKRES